MHYSKLAHETSILLFWLHSKVDNQLDGFLKANREQLIQKLKKYSILFSGEDLKYELQASRFAYSNVDSLSVEDLDTNNKEALRIGYLILHTISNDFFNEVKKSIPTSSEEIRQCYPILKEFLIRRGEQYKQQVIEDAKSIVCNAYDYRDLSSENFVEVLSSFIYDIDHENPLFQRLKKIMTNKVNLALYPSSGIDYSDVQYFESIGNSIFEEHKIFIHIDFMQGSEDMLNAIPESLFLDGNADHFTFNSRFSQEAEITIVRLPKKLDSIWVILFSKTRNEEVLLKLIKNRVRINTVFCKCDGITSGMGSGIPTPLYIYFRQYLSLNRLISEYSVMLLQENNNNFMDEKREYFLEWIHQNLHPDEAISIESIVPENIGNLLNGQVDELLMNERFRPEILSDDYFYRDFYLITPKD